MTILHFIFIATAFFSVYIQTKSYALKDQPEKAAEYEDLLRIRRVMSPLIAGMAALMVAFGAFVISESPRFLGVLFTAVWAFASLGDIFIEGSYSTEDEAVKGRYYIIGMALFILFTLGLGVGLSYYAVAEQGATFIQLGIALVVAAALGVAAYRTLAVTEETRAIMLVYVVAVVSLLCGGILSAITGNAHLAYIGIGYFFSDWFVGLRDFGKNVPRFLQRHVLILILILYYTIMLTSIDLVL
ncbi:hypothetical protein KQH61_03385 [bacterium]|nr:hypothetical protein [bacterium]MCB2178943.1 hypothetical protein [bacterium]